jgi:hypothetical protein
VAIAHCLDKASRHLAKGAMKMQKTQSPLIGENILSVDATFYKGCINEKEESIEIYKATVSYLVCVDNIVVHDSKSKRDALARYGEYFG